MLLLPLEVTLLEEVAELFRRGLSIREVSRRTGVSFGVVRATLVRKGLHRINHKRVRHGLVVCKSCGQEKVREAFPGLAYGTYCCRDCLAVANHDGQVRRHGQTTKEYQALLDKQNGQCAICGAREGHRSSRGRECRLAIDHDHRSGAVRGLLCNNCNRGLGRFKDSVDLLEAALRYLQRGQ
jgi:hypothetical protein